MSSALSEAIAVSGGAVGRSSHPIQRDSSDPLKISVSLFLNKEIIEKVPIFENAGDDLTSFELRVHKEDLGRVIGKQGRTARSIRTILSSAGMKLKKRIVFEIIE